MAWPMMCKSRSAAVGHGGTALPKSDGPHRMRVRPIKQPRHGAQREEFFMSRKISRRKFMAGTVAGAAAATFKFPAPAIAQAAPFKLGLLTVKTGPLAQGGIQMEQGIVTFLKEKNYTFAGR